MSTPVSPLSPPPLRPPTNPGVIPNDIATPMFDTPNTQPTSTYTSNNSQPLPTVPASIKNDCSPARIYGGFNQTLFMGISVSSFSISLGIDGQIGELTIQLVEDTDNCGDKIYYDENLERQIHTGADPGFITPVEGAPYYFRVGDFEYTGILQSWTLNEGESGKVYQVKLTDPTPILEGVKLLLNGTGYVDSVQGIPNVINIYGFAEAFGASGKVAPLTQAQGMLFGSPADAIGGSETNETGMPVDLILLSLSTMVSSVPEYQSIYNSFGRIVGPGSPPNVKYGAMNPDKAVQNVNYPYQSYYLIDFSNFPLPPEYYRINQAEISVLELITQIATEGGYSFYIELLPIKYNGKLYKVIKPRLISKLYLGQHPNSINEFLSANPLATAKNYGREFRNEPTSSMIVGANQEGILQSTQIKRFFGLDGNGNIRTGGSHTGSSGIVYDYYIWDISKDVPGYDTVFVKIYLAEMEAAAHSQESFEAVTYKIAIDLGDDSQNFGYYFRRLSPDWESSFSFTKLDELFSDFQSGKTIPIKKSWGVKFEADYFELSTGLRKTLENAFNYVANIANTYCGKQFIIPLSYSVTGQDQVTGLLFSTEEPCESGWSEEDYILGLNRSLTTIFSDDNSKVRPFAIINATNNQCISTDNYLFYDNAYVIRDSITRTNVPTPESQHYITCGVDSQLVYQNNLNLIGPHAVVIFDNSIIQTGYGNNLSLIVEHLRSRGFAESLIQQFAEKMHGTEYLNLGIQRINGKPLAVAIPLKNNYITYGPWVYTGAPGNANIEKDDTLSPWEYGSEDLMNIAGQNRANSVAVNTQSVETGSITLPGYPSLSIGAELLSNAASTIETRNILLKNTTGLTNNKKYLNINEGMWTGLKGPNITNISCEVGQNGITTTYEMRSYTSVYGRFNRYLFDRLKLLGQQDLRMRRANILNRLDFEFTLSKQSDYVKHSVARMASGLAPLNYAAFDALRRSRSPVNVMSGNIYNDATAEGEQEHADVGINKSNSILNEMHSSGYANKAFMSLDGLFRPVSKSGDGGFPKFNPNAVAKAPGGGVAIGANELYPFPSGHDIEILARGASPPSDGKSLYVEGDYADDYRFFAHRGPMVLTGWGYDTNGKPIPNEKDINAEEGKFDGTSLTNNFKTDYLSNSRTWATGPVDLRYDRDRGVWTAAPQSQRMLICEIIEENNDNKKQRTDQGLDFSTDPPTAWYGAEEDSYEMTFDPRETKQRKYRAKVISKSTTPSADGTTVTNEEIYVYPIDKRVVLDKYDKVMVYFDTIEEKYYVIEHFADNKIYYGKVVSHGLNCENDLNVAIADVIPFTDDFVEPEVGVAEDSEGDENEQVERGTIKVHFFNVRPFSFPFTLHQKVAFAKIKGIFVALGDYSTPIRFAIGRVVSQFILPGQSGQVQNSYGYLVQYSMNAPNEAFPIGACKGPIGGSFGEIPCTNIGTQVGSNNFSGLGYTPINRIGYAHNILGQPIDIGSIVYLYLDESSIPESYSGEPGQPFNPPEALFFILRATHYGVCVINDIRINQFTVGGCSGNPLAITINPTTIYLDTSTVGGVNADHMVYARSKMCEDVEYECCSGQQQQGQSQTKKIPKEKFKIATDLFVQSRQQLRCF